MTEIKADRRDQATIRRWRTAASKIRGSRRILLVLAFTVVGTSVGYAFVLHSASRVMEALTQSCALHFEIELQKPGNPPPPRVLLNAMCGCLTRALLNRNGVWRLALVDLGWRDLQALKRVTEDDEVKCVDGIVEPEVELAKR